MKIEKVVYRGRAKATGGRDGRVTTSGGDVDVKLTTPKELGGGGGAGANPEELFAAGYSACFIGAMKFAAMQQKTKLPDDTSINGIVGIGAVPGGFGIEVELQIHVPGMDKAAVKAIVDKAHTVCPYSNATRGNVQVTLTVV
jgi:osmotically inducible protein OsmC